MYHGSKSVYTLARATLACKTCAMPLYHAIFLCVLGIRVAIPQKLSFSLFVVDNSMFTCMTSPLELQYDLDNLFESYKYTQHNRCHFEKDVDPENNYYNISISCRYYAEQQFNSYLNVNYNGGISLIHFNARSLRH